MRPLLIYAPDILSAPEEGVITITYQLVASSIPIPRTTTLDKSIDVAQLAKELGDRVRQSLKCEVVEDQLTMCTTLTFSVRLPILAE